MNPERKGMVWSLSKITVLLGSIILFTILWSFHLGFKEINSQDSAIQEAKNIAHIIDAVGSSIPYCEATYKTPERLYDRGYSVEIDPGRVTISLDDAGITHQASFTSEIKNNLTFRGGRSLKIRKQGKELGVY